MRALESFIARGTCFVLALAIAFSTEDAVACDFAGHVPLTIDASRAGPPPAAIEDVTFTIERGRGPTGGCGKQMATSCDGTGTLTLHFRPPDTGETPRSALGYRVEVVDGKTPSPGMFPSEPILASLSDSDSEATLFFFWDDGSDDDQEVIEFTLMLTPIAPSGEEGPTSDPIRIGDPGSGGCATTRAPRARTPVFVGALSAIALAALRRRASRRGGASSC